MFALGLALLSLFIGAVNVNAQSSSGGASLPIPSLSPCIQSCLTQALPLGQCGNIQNLTCVCSSTAFQGAAAGCLSANCSTADQATALTLQTTECALVSGSSSSGASSSTSSSPSSSTSGVSSGSSNSSSNTTGTGNTTGNSTGGSTNTTGGGTNSGALSLVMNAPSSAFGTLALVAAAMFGGALVVL